MDGLMETMIDLTPEALADEDIRQGLTRKEDRHEAVIRYYRAFNRGQNHIIAQLRRLLNELTNAR